MKDLSVYITVLGYISALGERYASLAYVLAKQLKKDGAESSYIDGIIENHEQVPLRWINK